MPPSTVTTTIQEQDFLEPKTAKELPKQRNTNNEKVEEFKPAGYFQTKLIWINIIGITLVHVLTVYGLLVFPYITKWPTFVWSVIIGNIAGFGVTGGAHRFWTHRSYKANLPLRIILMLCYTTAGQNSLFQWVRDHRVHHKYSETDADPHNANRGFFFSHCGWLMMKKHPDVYRKGKLVDMSDVLADPVVQFQEKYFSILKFVTCFFIPIAVPVYFWNEGLYWSFLATVGRYIIILNATWSVNSAAHLYGTRPYDKNINPRENLAVAIMALGEGWHNYHHTFPWDYKASELGKTNLTTFWINKFAKLGWAYDLKSPSQNLVMKTIKKSGDGTYSWGHHEVPESEDNHLAVEDKCS